MKKVALITGGSRGIGLGIANELARNGFNLAINGVRDESAVAPVLDNLRASGVDVFYCQGNIAKAGDRDTIIEKIKHYYRGLNVQRRNRSKRTSGHSKYHRREF